MKWNARLWKNSVAQFTKFMTPLVATLGRSERRRAATHYVEGLLMPGQRKSIEPMAARVGVDSQSLQQLVTSSPWSDDRVWRAIRQEVIPHLEPLEAWIVDETGWLKQGQHSVGVSHQYCGAVGKQANCQVSVELAVSDGWVAAPLGGQLYLPQSWTQDRERCTQVGVPEEVPFRSKPELGLELIRQALDDGVPPAPVLGDCVYGDSPEFREGVRQLGMEFFLQTSGRHKAWTHPVTTERKRVRRYVAPGVPPAQTLAEITATFPAEQWKACSWQAADGHARRTRLAWCEVYLQHKLREGDDDLERVWLVVDWPAGEAEPYHYVLAHFHQPPRRARCLRLSRSRWHIEQYFQRGKDDLGLDHFEGRTWRGFHHHLVLSALAYLFILTRYVCTKKNFWCDVGTDTASDPAVAGEIDRLLLLLRQQV
jgi:SRSO17 transposase